MTQPPHIRVINGPNLNLLGEREPQHYGSETLDQINDKIRTLAEALGLQVSFFQSNHEGELVTAIQEARQDSQGLILNPGAYAHTSVAIRDAATIYPHPVIEVHLSNLHARDAFRHHSYLSAVATGVISGLGAEGYLLALRALKSRLG